MWTQVSDFHGAYMKYARTQLKFSKMAAKRSVHSAGFLYALNTLSTADFCLPSKKKRLEGGRLYSVERVVACRKEV